MTVVVAAVGLIVGLLGIVLALVAMSRARQMAAVTAKRIRSELVASGPLDPRAIRDVAVVRYDALEEMAGQLSFSVALLNAQGDGVVLTSINGRTETRTYAKVVADGKGVHQLSPEEQQAVRSAQLGHGPPTLLTQAPRLVGGHGPVRPATAEDAARVRAAASGTPAQGAAAAEPGRHAGTPGRHAGAPDGQDRVRPAAGAKPGGPAGSVPPAAAPPPDKTARPAGRPAPSGAKPGAPAGKPAEAKPGAPVGRQDRVPVGRQDPAGEKTRPAGGKAEPAARPDGGARGPAQEPAGRRLRKGA